MRGENLGLFDKIFNKKEQERVYDSFFKTLNAYVPAFTNWQGSIYESELVRAAIDAKARHISKMSVRCEGSAKPELQTRLRVAPNEWQTWSQFLYRTATILEVNNTAFIVPIIDSYDNTTGIFTVLPDRCEIVQYKEQPFLRYYFSGGQTASIELERCGILTKYQYMSDFLGTDNRALNQTMQLIDIQNQGISEGVKAAATYRFMARVNNFSKAEDLKKERQRFSRENLEGEGGGILLFPNTYADIKQIETKPFVVDADQMKVINTNVFNYYGVNEKIMQSSAGAEDLDAFYNGQLEPFAIQLAEVLTKMLYSRREQASGSHIVVTSDRLQYMSVASKTNLLQTMGDRGMLTVNEGRQLLNYAPIPGGDKMMPIRGEYYNAAEKEVNKDGEE